MVSMAVAFLVGKGPSRFGKQQHLSRQTQPKNSWVARRFKRKVKQAELQKLKSVMLPANQPVDSACAGRLAFLAAGAGGVRFWFLCHSAFLGQLRTVVMPQKQIFNDFCRFSPVLQILTYPPKKQSIWERKFLEENRMQKIAGTYRKVQIDVCPSRFNAPAIKILLHTDFITKKKIFQIHLGWISVAVVLLGLKLWTPKYQETPQNVHFWRFGGIFRHFPRYLQNIFWGTKLPGKVSKSETKVRKTPRNVLDNF